MRKLCFALFIACGLARASDSPTGVSGGGHILYCTQNALGQPQASVQLLDYFESRRLYAGEPRYPVTEGGNANATVVDKALIGVERLRARSPMRAKLYSQRVRKFLDEAHWSLTPLKLIENYDAHITEGCEVKQLAYQRQRLMPQDSVYMVDLNHWNQLPYDDRAGLILHEVIYREFLLYGHENSLKVRRLNAALATDEIGKRLATPKLFLAALYDLNVPETDIAGLWTRVWDFRTSPPAYRPFTFHPNGEIRTARVDAIKNDAALIFGDDYEAEERPYSLRGTPVWVALNDPRRNELPVEITLAADGTLQGVKVVDSTLGYLQVGEPRTPARRLSWEAGGQLTLE